MHAGAGHHLPHCAGHSSARPVRSVRLSMNATDILSGLGGADGGQSSAMPGAATLLAAGSTAVVGYALWEQIKFRMYRAGKDGYQMPGEFVCMGAMTMVALGDVD